MDEIVAKIASKQLGINISSSRGRDELDFREISIWELKKALETAFRAGVEVGVTSDLEAQSWHLVEGSGSPPARELG